MHSRDEAYCRLDGSMRRPPSRSRNTSQIEHRMSGDKKTPAVDRGQNDTEQTCVAVKAATRETLAGTLPPSVTEIVLDYYHRSARDRLDALLFELARHEGYLFDPDARVKIGRSSMNTRILAIQFSTLYCRLFGKRQPERLVPRKTMGRCDVCGAEGERGGKCPDWWNCGGDIETRDIWAPRATRAFWTLAREQPEVLQQAVPDVLRLTDPSYWRQKWGEKQRSAEHNRVVIAEP